MVRGKVNFGRAYLKNVIAQVGKGWSELFIVTGGEGGIRSGAFLQPSGNACDAPNPSPHQPLTLDGHQRSFPVVSGRSATTSAQVQHTFPVKTSGGSREKVDIIYTRFSSQMQRVESCKDQERNIREGLKKMGIVLQYPLVINDMAESGTKEERAEYSKLIALIRAGKVRLLAVDDQARLSRSDSLMPLIRDLIYCGGRFISVQEHIDTSEKGWELKVKVMELHNSTTITELGHRVRRGQAGRVLDGNGSAGDIRFGYRTRFLDPNHAEQSRRGPKPKKEVYVFEEEAKWVLWMFERFALDHWSIGAIARELNKLGVEKGRKATRPKWRAELVRRVLQHEKYVGRWSWGGTTTIRSSTGKKKQVRVKDGESFTTNRPNLRIVQQDLWDKAQQRLKELHEVYGRKAGQQPRGPRVHHTEIYPMSLSGGLLFCGRCGARLNVQCSTGMKYLGCPNHRNGTCAMVYRPRMDVAEQKLLEFLSEVLTGWPEWMALARLAMQKSLAEMQERQPEETAAKQRRLDEVRRLIKNLVDAIEQGSLHSKPIVDRIHVLGEEERRLAEEINKTGHTERLALPDEAWFKEKMAKLAELLQGKGGKIAVLLRKILGKVAVHEILPPGKKKGYGEMRFRIDGWSLLKEFLGAPAVTEVSSNGGTLTISPEFCISMGEPTHLDSCATQIVEMRADGKTWKEICRVTGVGMGSACVAYKRWKQALKDSTSS